MAENRFASLDAPAEAPAHESASPSTPAPGEGSPEHGRRDEGRGLVPFAPVPLRYRHDGLTPAKQREYVEALADTGLAREAAARVGISEQAIARVRRRADARSFDIACDAAVRDGVRRLRSIAFERAIEGTIKQHFYHGELKGEERVYDNRLLIWLLSKLGHLADPPPEARRAAADWERWMEAVEQGARPPDPEAEAREASLAAMEVWEDEDGTWWTSYPPPAGFEGEAEGEPGDEDYKRTLSPAEQAVIDDQEEQERLEALFQDLERRDRCFGFDGGGGEELFSTLEAETSETSAKNARE